MVPSNQDRQHLLASILREHADCVAAGRTLDVTLAQLARGACDITGCLPDWGLIRIIDPDTLFERQDVRSDGTVLRPFPSSRAERRGIADRAIRERQPQIVEDVSSDPDYVLIDGRVHSEMAVPLLANGKCWGVLNLESDQTGHFTADMISWVESLASQAVLTIQGDMLRARPFVARHRAHARCVGVRHRLEYRTQTHHTRLHVVYGGAGIHGALLC